MGNSSSDEESECFGYRVLGVQESSPASKVGLVSFFDFIVAANGVPLKELDNKLIEMIKASEDKPLPLTVFNYKARSSREVILTPSKKWPGQGMLGVTIRFDTFHNADENLIRVLEVTPGSPAQIAGLIAEKDYILGTAEKVFRDPDMLFAELQLHNDQPMELYVYNTDTDAVRVTVILPTRKWGGEGCLGCSVGAGYIHRLPEKSRGTTGASSVTYKPVEEENFQAEAPSAPSSRRSRSSSDAMTISMFPPNRPNFTANDASNRTEEEGKEKVSVLPEGEIHTAPVAKDVELSVSTLHISQQPGAESKAAPDNNTSAMLALGTPEGSEAEGTAITKSDADVIGSSITSEPMFTIDIQNESLG